MQYRKVMQLTESLKEEKDKPPFADGGSVIGHDFSFKWSHEHKWPLMGSPFLSKNIILFKLFVTAGAQSSSSGLPAHVRVNSIVAAPSLPWALSLCGEPFGFDAERWVSGDRGVWLQRGCAPSTLSSRTAWLQRGLAPSPAVSSRLLRPFPCALLRETLVSRCSLGRLPVFQWAQGNACPRPPRIPVGRIPGLVGHPPQTQGEGELLAGPRSLQRTLTADN